MGQGLPRLSLALAQLHRYVGLHEPGPLGALLGNLGFWGASPGSAFSSDLHHHLTNVRLLLPASSAVANCCRLRRR